MKIKINSKEANLSISVPLSLASTCVRLIPSKEISKEDKKWFYLWLRVVRKRWKIIRGLKLLI